MATRNGGPASPQAHVSTRPSGDSHPSASDSTSSALGANQQRGTVCRWRTARYHDQECARYFDCPSHIVERALSDSEQELTEEHGEHDQARRDAGSEDAEDRRGAGSVSSSNEERNEGGGRQGGPSPSPDGPSASAAAATAADASPGGRGEPGEEGRRSGPSGSTSPVQSRGRTDSQRSGTAGSGSRDGASGPVTAPGPAPTTRGSGAVSGQQATSTHAPVVASPSLLTPNPPPPAAGPSGASEIVLPRWQPDSEVTYCPICRTQFSIFVRKHHCRKCGRVVCNSCSPHRITIPYQYIVRPPGAPRIPARRPASLLDSQTWYPEFGGGERVRLCNPCVPDPNTAPPRAQEPHARPHALQTDNNPVSSTWSYYFGTGTGNDAPARNRSATMPQQPGVPSYRPAHPLNTQSRILSGTPPAYYRHPPTLETHHVYPAGMARYRSILDVGDRPGPSSSASNRRLPPIPPPQPQIPEEDECPVCHRELPSRTLPNFESLREAHINACITAHSTYGGGAHGSSSSSSSAAAAAAAAATAAGGSESTFQPRRRTGMFPYTATEKDCVDSAECSICLEEFEVGVPMARLECLCRFHRRCISAWWERHPGRCPMHQHDGFGY